MRTLGCKDPWTADFVHVLLSYFKNTVRRMDTSPVEFGALICTSLRHGVCGKIIMSSIYLRLLVCEPALFLDGALSFVCLRSKLFLSCFFIFFNF